MNITNPIDNSFKPQIEPPVEAPKTSVFSILLTFIKIILVLGILFFILYEINKQTNNSIMNYINQLFKPKSNSSSSSAPVNTGTSNVFNDWMTSLTTKQSKNNTLLNSSTSTLFKEPPYDIESKLKNNYTVSNPQPDDSTSKIQEKKGYCYIGSWSGSDICVNNYDTCYSGKIYDTKEECISKNK